MVGQNILRLIFHLCSPIGHMVRISRYIMKIVLVIMLFQFFAPSFLPSVVQQFSPSRTTSIHAPHSSIVAPQLLKEKDEKSEKQFTSVSNLAAILDFTAHSSNLTATHKGKVNYFHHDQLFDLQPALFACLCTFLI